MRYHNLPPENWTNYYGQTYRCNHPVYRISTLYLDHEKGLCVIQQRFNEKTKSTTWSATELVEILEKIRTHFNKPVTITSAFRTASWNAKQKNAAKYSQHLYGKAADIQVQGISVEQVYAYADKLLAGRGGVGIYPPGLGRANGWVHVDVRKEKSRWRG